MQDLSDDAVGNAALLVRYRTLPERARALISVPVNVADLDKNQCLNVLAVLADRVTAIGDDIIIKGMVLSKDRGHDTQRQDDRERAWNVAKLRLGDAIGSGPQICLVDYKLQSACDLLQIPYLFEEMASDINGEWGTTWFLWVAVAESQLGQECEMSAGVAVIVKMVWQTARSGRMAWCHQERVDYCAYAPYLFRRDYRDWREGKPDSAKPSLLRILDSKDFKEHLTHAVDYASKVEARPDMEPYDRVVIGAGGAEEQALDLHCGRDRGGPRRAGRPGGCRRWRCSDDTANEEEVEDATEDPAHQRAATERRRERRRKRRRSRWRRRRQGRRQRQGPAAAADAQAGVDEGRGWRLGVAEHAAPTPRREVRDRPGQARRLGRHRQGRMRVLLPR